MCEDCGSCFSGGYGLAFHKSRSPNCTNLSDTYPALLAYESTNVQSLPGVNAPINIPEIAEDSSQEQTMIVVPNLEESLLSTASEVTAGVRREQETFTSNAVPGKNINPAPDQRMSIISSEIPLEDLGLLSDSTNDEDFISSSKSHLHTGPVNLASDPDTMFEAVREGDKSWPKVPDVLENSTNRMTKAGDTSKQGVTRINEKDVSISLRLDGPIKLTQLIDQTTLRRRCCG